MTGEKGEVYGLMQQDSTVIEETMTFDMFMGDKTDSCFKNKIWKKKHNSILDSVHY